MIDNLELIKPLLKFESEDDFYYLQILQRKKDNPDIGSNSRVIKNYYIRNIPYFDTEYSEIKELCRVFNARASLRLNKRSFRKVAFKTLENIANTMQNETEYPHIRKSYDRACGLLSNEKANKKWIVDIDEEDLKELDFIKIFITELYSNAKKEDGLLLEVPSKSGIHLITNPFNVQDFKKVYPQIDIHKDNPTNLYML